MTTTGGGRIFLFIHPKSKIEYLVDTKNDGILKCTSAILGI